MTNKEGAPILIYRRLPSLNLLSSSNTSMSIVAASSVQQFFSSRPGCSTVKLVPRNFTKGYIILISRFVYFPSTTCSCCTTVFPKFLWLITDFYNVLYFSSKQEGFQFRFTLLTVCQNMVWRHSLMLYDRKCNPGE